MLYIKHLVNFRWTRQSNFKRYLFFLFPFFFQYFHYYEFTPLAIPRAVILGLHLQVTCHKMVCH
jgi:hypothetical protein